MAMGMKVAEAYLKITADATAMNQGLGQLKGQVAQAVGSMKGMLAAVGVTVGIGAMVRKAVMLTSEMEKSKIAFNVIIKDVERTNELMGKLSKFAAVTPFTDTEVIKAGQALVQANVPLEKIEGTLKRVGDLAAGGGGNFSELISAWVKLRGVGKLEAEVEERFMTQGISLRALGEQIGITGEKWSEMRKKGQLTFEFINDMLEKATTGTGTFANAMALQAQSMDGLWSTLTSNVDAILRSIGEGLSPAIKSMLEMAIEKTNAWSEALKGTDTDVGMVTKSVAWLMDALDMLSLAWKGAGLIIETLKHPIDNLKLMTMEWLNVFYEGIKKVLEYLKPMERLMTAGYGSSLAEMQNALQAVQDVNASVMADMYKENKQYYDGLSNEAAQLKDDFLKPSAGTEFLNRVDANKNKPTPTPATPGTSIPDFISPVIAGLKSGWSSFGESAANSFNNLVSSVFPTAVKNMTIGNVETKAFQIQNGAQAMWNWMQGATSVAPQQRGSLATMGAGLASAADSTVNSPFAAGKKGPAALAALGTVTGAPSGLLALGMKAAENIGGRLGSSLGVSPDVVTKAKLGESVASSGGTLGANGAPIKTDAAAGISKTNSILERMLAAVSDKNGKPTLEVAK